MALFAAGACVRAGGYAPLGGLCRDVDPALVLAVGYLRGNGAAGGWVAAPAGVVRYD